MKTAGLRPPVFESRRGYFRAILYNTPDHGATCAGKTGKNTALLDFCEISRTREEIAAFLHVKSPYYAMRRYVTPLVNSGALQIVTENGKNAYLRR